MRKGLFLLALLLTLAIVSAALAADTEKGQPANVAEEKKTEEKKTEEFVVFKTFEEYQKAYKYLFFKLNIGYEYASVNKMFQSGFPRVGLSLYSFHYQKPLKEETGGFTFGVHQSFTAQLTSSAEQQSTTNLSGIQNLGDKPAFEFETQLFLPVLKTQGGAQLFGPIGVLGAKKVDDLAKVDSRIYYGVRLARNPEMYADFLYGKTESITAGRLEVRGQFPIYKDTLYLGGIGNFGVVNRDTSKEADIVRVYLTWNVDVKKLFGGFFKFFEETSEGKTMTSSEQKK